MMQPVLDFGRKTRLALKRLPFLQEAVWETKRIVRPEFQAYNGRWQLVEEWLKALDNLPPGHKTVADRKVLVFASTAFYVECLLAASVVMASRGCEIDFVWLPFCHGVPYEDQERFQQWSDRFPVPKHSRVRILRLSDFEPAQATEEMESIAKTVADFDSRYCLRKEEIDLVGNKEDREFHAFRLQRNLDAMRRLKTYCDAHRFDSALTGNGRVFEMGCFHAMYSLQYGNCASIDTFDYGNDIVASQDVPAIDWNADVVWNHSAPREMTPDIERRVSEYLAFRENPSLQLEAKIQPAGPEDAVALRSRLGLKEDRPIALLCTNVAWDSAVIGRGRAFSTMKQWYLDSIRWFSEHPQWQLVIRTHPAEAFVDQPISVTEFIEEAFPRLPANVRLVRPADKVNTYAVIRISNLGIAFSSTVGLEMAMRGLPAILAGKVHYSDKGFTIDPKSETEYFEILDQAVRGDIPKMDQRQIDLAKCYFVNYFDRFPKKVPWRIWALREDLLKWPMAKIVAGDCPKEFLDTFDFLAGRQVAGLV